MRLTRDEIKLVVFLLGALLLGVTIKHVRHRDRLVLPPAPAHAAPPPKGEVDFE
jgi:hypothetical protein